MANTADFAIRLKDKFTRQMRGVGNSIGTAQMRMRDFRSTIPRPKVFTGMRSGIRGIGVAAAGATAALVATGGAVFGLVKAVQGIAGVGSSFEDTQNQIAGTLTALGQAGDFQEGLKIAESTIRLIRKDSAALPGEAEDYISIFRAGLPVVQKSIGGSIEDMTAFTNKFSAITATLGIDTEQAGNDLRRLLQVGRGGAGIDVRSFTQLLPFMQQVSGFADITAESFNEMSEAARAQLLTKTFEQLQPMLDNASTSFDAMAGALKSQAKEIFRLTTKPLFESMKVGLERVNALFADSEGSLTPLGQQIVDMGKSVADFVVPAIEHSFTLIKEFGKGFGAAVDVDTFKNLGKTILETLANPSTIESIRMLASTLGTMFTIGTRLLDWALKLTPAVLAVHNAMFSVLGVISDALAPIVSFAANLVGGLVTGIRSMIPQFVAALSNMASQGVSAFKSFFGISSPSRLMMEQAGFIGMGIERGITDSIPGVRSAMDQMSSAGFNSFGSGVDISAAGTVQSAATSVAAVPQPRAQESSTVSASQTGSSSPTINLGGVTINAQPGQSAEEVGNAAAQAIRRQLMNVFESMAPA